MTELTIEERDEVEAWRNMSDVDAEQAVLGILLDPLGRNEFWENCYAEILRHVDEDDFFRESHRLIFRAVCDLADQGQRAEFAAVLPRIPHQEATYLASLVGVYAGCALAGHYATRIHDLANKRRLYGAITPMVRALFDPNETARSAAEKAHFLLDSAAKGLERGAGVFDISDVSEEVYRLYEQGVERGYSTGWAAVDPLYSVVPGEWTLVTGIPSHGKSAWLDALLVNLARDHGLHTVVCSPENQPLALHALKWARLWAGKPFTRRAVNRMSLEELTEALGKEYEHFTFVLPHEDERSVSGVLSLTEAVIDRRKVDGLVIDPWNELEHSRPKDKSETEYISESLTRLRNFARRHRIHVWLVAHPKQLHKDPDGKYAVPRPYEISGSAHWYNKADNIIAVYRPDDDSHVQIHVQKIRFDANGKRGMAVLYYDPLTGEYHEGAERAA